MLAGMQLLFSFALANYFPNFLRKDNVFLKQSLEFFLLIAMRGLLYLCRVAQTVHL